MAHQIDPKPIYLQRRMPPPSPPENVRPGVEEVTGTATAAQVKTEAGEDDGGLINVKVQSQIAADVCSSASSAT